MKKSRKGFTLMELLIVITVLGSLAAMMSISGSEAMTTAKAGNIIANLRNLSTAVHEYFYDNRDSLYNTETTLPARSEIWYYMNKGVSDDTKSPEGMLSNYYIATENKASNSLADVDWYVGYQFPTTAGAQDAIAIKAKLKGRAAEVGLFGGTMDNGVITLAGDTENHNLYNEDAIVWMKVYEKSRRTSGS